MPKGYKDKELRGRVLLELQRRLEDGWRPTEQEIADWAEIHFGVRPRPDAVLRWLAAPAVRDATTLVLSQPVASGRRRRVELTVEHLPS